LGYGTVVAAIVRSRFSQDEVEAIQLNFLADASSGSDEFNALQAWRVMAKRIAREVAEDDSDE